MDTKPTFHKTRIAPTPSGYLHLGNVLSFAVTAALAKKAGADILLRIDDLDRDRISPDYVQDVFDTLHFLQILYQVGARNLPDYASQWSQVHRMEMYNQALQQLKEQGAVFACNCSRAQIKAINKDDTYPGTCRHKNIPLDTENVSWRLKTEAVRPLSVKTLSGDTLQANLPATMCNFVVRKKDGYPAYQLTSVLDDLHYDVDLIVRGQDLWDSTLAQLYLAACLGDTKFSGATFYHHPLLMADDGNKLSKSAGDTSIKYLRAAGKSRADIFEMLLAIAGLDEEITTLLAGWLK